MKAEFYVSNMGRLFLDLDNSFSDVVVGCASYNDNFIKTSRGICFGTRGFHKAQVSSN